MATKQKPSPVAARDQLNQLDEEQTDPKARLEAEAKEQEKQQAEELKAGKGGTAPKQKTPPGQRTGTLDRVQGGFVDNMSRRNGTEALEGHHVSIDLTNKAAAKELERVGLEGRTQGVYFEPGVRDAETGYPETAIVKFKGAMNLRVELPYDSLSHVDAQDRA